MNAHINELIQLGVEHQASDLHLSAGSPPIFRVNGTLRILYDEAISHAKLTEMLKETMLPSWHIRINMREEIDYAFTVANHTRIRANVFWQQRGLSAVWRFLPSQVKTINELCLPRAIQESCGYQHGLVAIAGSAGSGKSTTLAAMINEINQHQSKHIITLEDPVEMIFENKRSLIHQRDVQRDTNHIQSALRSILRQNPDVIVVGEMRDAETMRLVLNAAESGHLVLTTMHASSVVTAIERMIYAFPLAEHGLVRNMLANMLRSLFVQELVPQKSGGRVAVVESLVMAANAANLIRENKLAQLYSIMQSGQNQGMQTKEQHIEILKKRMII